MTNSTGPRVVLDTNCLVSALLFRAGRLSWLRSAWQAGIFVPLGDRATTSELLRVLRYPKFRLSEADYESLLSDYLPHVEVVPAGEDDPMPADLRDPADWKFVALARRGGADILVTGDLDLLDIRDRLDGPVVLTPAEFRDRLGARP